ncbi:UNVERIFIED_CONTAM: Nucleoside diphosphate kinase, chloroplastic [Sesamum calycinum]|uniref:Nucleoside diphosphate kinase n=1 Tax=Sesamum calycinum TaxID=2727403 RepID=A0AAW2KDT5_9LAMI
MPITDFSNSCPPLLSPYTLAFTYAPAFPTHSMPHSHLFPKISEIISRFERKGFKLVAIKVVVPSKDFAKKHYHDLKERPFFSGLCDFLSSGPVIAMVWEGEGVIRYGRKLIGATDPQKSEPGTIRGDLAVQVGRNIIHGSDGPETAKDEIKLWFKPDELVNYTSNEEKWIYGG